MFKLRSFFFLVFLVLIHCSDNSADGESLDISTLPAYLEIKGDINDLIDLGKNDAETSSIIDHLFLSTEQKNAVSKGQETFTRLTFDQRFSSTSIDTGQVLLRIYLGNRFLDQGEYTFANYNDFKDTVTLFRDVGYNKNLVTAEFHYWEAEVNDENLRAIKVVKNDYYVSQSGTLDIFPVENGEFELVFSIDFARTRHLNTIPSFENNKLTISGKFNTTVLETGYSY